MFKTLSHSQFLKLLSSKIERNIQETPTWKRIIVLYLVIIEKKNTPQELNEAY